MNQVCPICYVPMKVWSDYLDGHTLLESGEECPFGCYTHNYGYGLTEVEVRIRDVSFLFHHHWAEDRLDTEANWGAIKELFEPARAALIEDLRRKASI